MTPRSQRSEVPASWRIFSSGTDPCTPGLGRDRYNPASLPKDLLGARHGTECTKERKQGHVGMGTRADRKERSWRTGESGLGCIGFECQLQEVDAEIGLHGWATVGLGQAMGWDDRLLMCAESCWARGWAEPTR